MNPAESLALTRYVKAGCPQQAFDEFTPDAWHDLLSDLRFVDCKEAAKRIARRQPFCAPAEIRAEVHRLRSERIGRAFHLMSPPPDCPDYGAWLTEARRAAGDGEYEDMVAPDLPKRDMRVLEAVFTKRPPDQTVERVRTYAEQLPEES
jgi:hypothetical protein